MESKEFYQDLLKKLLRYHNCIADKNDTLGIYIHISDTCKSGFHFSWNIKNKKYEKIIKIKDFLDKYISGEMFLINCEDFNTQEEFDIWNEFPTKRLRCKSLYELNIKLNLLGASNE